MARFFTVFWLLLWALAALWFANRVVLWGIWLEDHQWLYTGLAVLGFALLVVMGALRLLLMALAVLRGRVPPRLARRYFRDTVADALFSFRTGGWGFGKESDR